MNPRTCPALLTAGTLILSFTAQAELVSADSPFGTDTLTRDTATGLEWLDLTVTQERSYDDIAGELGAGGEFEGFRHATVAEVMELWSNAGIADIATHDPPAVPADYSAANLQPVLDLIDLLGTTLVVAGNPLTEGFTADSPDGIPQVNIIGELNACLNAAFCNNLGVVPNTALASLGPNRDGRNEVIFFVGHYLARVTAQDSDGDGLADDADNCLLQSNADQRDTDGDGIGNLCDPDFNQDCDVNFQDLGQMKSDFFQQGDLDTDLDGSGDVNFLDLGIMKSFFFLPPGPSGLANPCSRAGQP